MNIIVKKGYENRDPFDTSDREPFGRNAGKGDRNRSASQAFKDGYDQINWGHPKRKRK